MWIFLYSADGLTALWCGRCLPLVCRVMGRTSLWPRDITPFIWQLRLSKTIVDSLTLKIPGRILRFDDNGRMKSYRYLPAKSEWSGKLAKFSAPYLNPTFSPPPPFPHPTLFSWRGYSNGFPTGRVGLPKFYRDAFTIFLKRIFPLRDRMLKHCQLFCYTYRFRWVTLSWKNIPKNC